MATTAGCAAMGAITGSSVANAALFTKIAVPEMVTNGYDKRLATACVAASGTLATLIPPSILAVVYGIVTETSVGKVLIAGFVPGVVSAAIYMGGIYVRVRLDPRLAPVAAMRASWGERFATLRPLWALTAVFAVVMGGIYTGLFTPTFAGAIGATGAFVLALLRRMAPATMWDALVETATLTANIMFIVVGGFVFARFLAFSGVIRATTEILLSLDAPPLVYLLGYMVVMIGLGMFLEAFSIMVLTLPVFFPILVGVGYDPVWLGIVTLKLIEMGLVSPPVGLNVYVVQASSPVPITMEELFRGIMPFLLLDGLTLALLIAFPQIVLFLPDLMS
jgi:tripartite ATP-independent transporter DctM subunit